MAAQPLLGRRFSIQGRVQGVGFRDFAQREANRRGIVGYVRNLADGSVLIAAVGPPEAMLSFESALRTGPRGADVRAFAVEEMPPQDFDGFRMVH